MEEKKQQWLEEAFQAATERIAALDAMLAMYRIGRRPSESLLDKMTRTQARWSLASAALAAAEGGRR